MLRRLFFNIWYFFSPPWDTGISPPELMRFIESNPPGRALDLGCGTGTNVITLAKHGWDATGVDFALTAIRIARRKARKTKVEVDLRVGDATKLDDLRGQFDLILDMGCYHNISPERQFDYIHNVRRLLNKNGTFLLYVFFRDPATTGPGITEVELQHISKSLSLIKREDGVNLNTRPSAWLMCQVSQE